MTNTNIKVIPGLNLEQFTKVKKRNKKNKKKVYTLDDRTPYIKIGNEKFRSDYFIFSDVDIDSDSNEDIPKKSFFRKNPVEEKNINLSVKSKVAELNKKQVSDTNCVKPASKRPGTTPESQPVRRRQKSVSTQ